MNKFGLLDPEDEAQSADTSLADKLAAFPVVKARVGLDLAAIDAAAAVHGFVSREASVAAVPLTRRRRAIPAEPTRHLAIRLSSSAYNRFVAYADRHQLTYHDALSRLMDTAAD